MSVFFTPSAHLLDLQTRLRDFMDRHVFPNERALDQEIASGPTRWKTLTLMEALKEKAQAAGLWNLFLPDSDLGAGLTNLEYATLCEIMGASLHGPEVFNCSPPDTGNMEVLTRYGTEAQKQEWLVPLLKGEIRSAFAMTEPDVASSDATNIATRITRDGDEYVINGRKWWISGAGHPRCRVFILMGKSDPDNPDRHRQQSMILVPTDAPGVIITRPLTVFGYDEAPHGHMDITFDNVRVPVGNMLLGPGRGFEIAQGRLGPGRIHHCMRQIGVAERALKLACLRLKSRQAFGKTLAEQGVWQERVANARIAIDQARLLTLNAAHMMDRVGNKAARAEIAMIKVVAPTMVCQVLDIAIQAHGGGGLSEDFPLASLYATARTLRFADGPDEVHRNAIARIELGKHHGAI